MSRYITGRDPAEGNFDFSNAVGFATFSDLTLTSTTNQPPDWVTKLSGSTMEVEEGRYVICWYAELTNSGNNNINWFRTQYKKTTDVTFIDACSLDMLIGRAEAYEIMSGFRVFDVDGDDTIDFRVQFARGDATARIRNANVYIFRVST
jgi:hypothetical protein